MLQEKSFSITKLEVNICPSFRGSSLKLKTFLDNHSVAHPDKDKTPLPRHKTSTTRSFTTTPTYDNRHGLTPELWVVPSPTLLEIKITYKGPAKPPTEVKMGKPVQRQKNIMAQSTYTSVVLAQRPKALIVPGETFTLKENPILSEKDLKDGEVLVESLYLSLDPAMRGWLNGTPPSPQSTWSILTSLSKTQDPTSHPCKSAPSCAEQSLEKFLLPRLQLSQ
jgi:hypothetical protein